MIGIVVVAHEKISEQMIRAMVHVAGPQENVAAISLMPDDDLEEKRCEILKAVEQVDCGDGVVIATDMFGGTPSNLAISVMDGRKVEVIAGLNLPMLVKLARERDRALKDVASEAAEAGRKYINVASELLV